MFYVFLLDLPRPHLKMSESSPKLKGVCDPNEDYKFFMEI